MINIEEIMEEITRYRMAYRDLEEKISTKTLEAVEWLDYFNAARHVAFDVMWQAGLRLDIDDLIRKKKMELKLKEETKREEKGTKVQTGYHPGDGHRTIESC